MTNDSAATCPREGRERVVTFNDPHAMRINRDLAEEIGFQESVVFLQIEYLVSISRHEFDGTRWTRQPLQELHEKHFPWWSPATIGRIINRLEERGLILLGRYNRSSEDRTRWFAINPEGVRELRSIAILQDEKSSEPEPEPNFNLQNGPETISQNEAPNLQNEKCIYIETTEKTSVERLPNGSPKKSEISSPPPSKRQVSKLSAEEAERRFEEVCESDPNGEALRELAHLLAEENQSGKVAITRVWRELGDRYVRMKEGYKVSDEAWTYGFEEAIRRSAPDLGYVLKAANGYRPTKHRSEQRSRQDRPKVDQSRYCQALPDESGGGFVDLGEAWSLEGEPRYFDDASDLEEARK